MWQHDQTQQDTTFFKAIFLKVIIWWFFIFQLNMNWQCRLVKMLEYLRSLLSSECLVTPQPSRLHLCGLIGQNLSGWHLFLTISYQCPLQYLCLSVRTQDQRNNLTLTHLLCWPGWHPPCQDSVSVQISLSGL